MIVDSVTVAIIYKNVKIKQVISLSVDSCIQWRSEIILKIHLDPFIYAGGQRRNQQTNEKIFTLIDFYKETRTDTN